MPGKKETKRKLGNKAYGAFLTTGFFIGAGPAFLTMAVDPYEVFHSSSRPSSITDLAEKAHYPLFKLAKYNKGAHKLVVLGDSRARALRDKYWHELGMTSALNLSYGGAQFLKFTRHSNSFEVTMRLRHWWSASNFAVLMKITRPE